MGCWIIITKHSYMVVVIITIILNLKPKHEWYSVRHDHVVTGRQQSIMTRLGPCGMHVKHSLDWLCHFSTWWRHQMATFSALPVLCAGNSPRTDELPWFSLICQNKRCNVFVINFTYHLFHWDDLYIFAKCRKMNMMCIYIYIHIHMCPYRFYEIVIYNMYYIVLE